MTEQREVPIEAQLVRMGLLTLEQLAEANRTRLENGGTVTEIAVANGWITPEQLAVVTGEAPAPAVLGPAVPPPAPAPAPAPVAEVAPPLRVAEPEAPPAPAPIAVAPPPAAAPAAPVAAAAAPAQHATHRVVLHLQGGERVNVASAADAAAAQQRAREIVFDLTRPRADEWPFYAGRFVRPDAIISVDVVTDT